MGGYQQNNRQSYGSVKIREPGPLASGPFPYGALPVSLGVSPAGAPQPQRFAGCCYHLYMNDHRLRRLWCALADWWFF
jgi:hypothetical protein